MAFVFIDNDFYKITLEFTRDFIDNNYDEWIENNNKEEIKISRWEMMIYFKKLNNVSQDTIDYFLIDAVSKLIVNPKRQLINNQSTIKQKIEKCKNPVFIKIIMLCRDIGNCMKNISSFVKDIINYIIDNEYTKYYDKENKIYALHQLSTPFCNYHNDTKPIFGYSNREYYNELECIIISIVRKHYRELLDNVEGYIIYCKTEKLKVDFNKIGKFINFIKEYVKSIYGFDLI